MTSYLTVLHITGKVPEHSYSVAFQKNTLALETKNAKYRYVRKLLANNLKESSLTQNRRPKPKASTVLR